MDLKYEFKYCSDEIQGIDKSIFDFASDYKNEFSLGDPVVDVD